MNVETVKIVLVVRRMNVESVKIVVMSIRIEHRICICELSYIERKFDGKGTVCVIV